MSYTVYAHIFPNGKRYVGITKQEPKERWKNGTGYRTQNLMWKAICKYKWHNIEHKILYEDLTEKEACRIEKELISKWKTNDAMYGYNVTSGGENGFVWHHTEEAKEKMSRLHRGKHLSKEHIEKIRKKAIGRPRTKAHIENNAKAKYKKIFQVDTNGNIIKVWDSMKEASQTLGIDKSSISMVCHGKRRSAGGYHWDYA